MGVKQVVVDDLTDDDLPGDTKPLTVTVEGTKYEVYLGEESKETFIAFLSGEAPLLKAKPARASRASSSTGSSVNTYGHDSKKVREWAIANKVQQANGNPVGERGRLGQPVYDAYHKAHA